MSWQFLPHIRFVGDERVVLASGCWGEGVALAQQNGRTIAELLAGISTERTDAWFVGYNPRN